MQLIVLSMMILVGTALLSLVFAKRNLASTSIACLGTVVAFLTGIVPAVRALLGYNYSPINFPWNVPYGSFSISLDALSALFLIAILFLSVVCAIYGAGYLRSHYNERRLAPAWFFFNVLVASMVLVVTARNGILFLFAWEVMALASYFLVTFNDEKESVRAAGITYLIATHVGTAFIFVLFAMLGKISGTMDFASWSKLPELSNTIAGAAFILAIIGFGTKAGIVPLHVWLPKAHPVAPSHVSAIMSGVMIKTGVYGILRTMTFLGVPQEWWGIVFVAVGSASGILGVIYAFSQKELKSLLAYSSVENIGIIFLGVGMGVVGLSCGDNVAATLGFCGAFFHVINHSLFKGLLFLSAGCVLSEAGIGEIDKLGGLMKKMPRTGLGFLFGSAAISGLPPLNGFIGEFLIYFSSFVAVVNTFASKTPNVSVFISAIVVIMSLALIGGLAATCFAKAFGIVFLGEPRSDFGECAHDPLWKMSIVPFALVAMSIAVVVFSPIILNVFSSAISVVSGISVQTVTTSLSIAVAPLLWIVAISSILILLGLFIYMIRRDLLKNRSVERVSTWDCGYAAPTAKMQYTGESFVQPVAAFFRPLMMIQKIMKRPEGVFPSSASFEVSSRDAFMCGFFSPVFKLIARCAGFFRFIQNGSVHLYILYIAITLLLLLVWKLGGF